VIRLADDIAGQAMGTRLYGRLLSERVIDPATGEILAERDDVLDHNRVRLITMAGVEEVKVRSPLTCELTHGICARCYGLDLGRGRMVEIGSAVGIVAAQSIGEPGTQLTLRTFHTGGVAAGGDITTGLPRVEELFEARRIPKGEAVVTEISGTVHVMQSDRYSDLRIAHILHSEMIQDEYDLPAGWTVAAVDASEVNQGDVIAYSSETGSEAVATITAQTGGRVRVETSTGNGASGSSRVIVSYETHDEKEYDIPSTARILVKDGDRVEAGQPLTEGSLNPHRILRIRGRIACQMYLLNEVQKVYRSQGQNINDKHFEVIIRKMMSRVQVTRPGDTGYLPGDLVDYLELKRINDQLLTMSKRPGKFVEILLGITKASLSTDSFLSASSFQHTIKVLAGAAIASTQDPLYGLKENVIIGKLIPAGTGFVHGRFAEEEANQRDLSTPLSADAGSDEEEDYNDLEYSLSD